MLYPRTMPLLDARWVSQVPIRWIHQGFLLPGGLNPRFINAMFADYEIG